MKNILFVFLATFSIHCFSQDTITTAKVKDYMDKEVCVIGKVVSSKLAAEGKKHQLHQHRQTLSRKCFYGSNIKLSPRKIEHQNRRFKRQKHLYKRENYHL